LRCNRLGFNHTTVHHALQRYSHLVYIWFVIEASRIREHGGYADRIIGEDVGLIRRPCAQRGFYLGGAHTVRGQRFGAAGGDAYWLGRGELGTALPLVRPVVFADIGWAGDRTHLGDVGRPLSGAGIGGSFVDGLLRLDVAKGIYPEKKVRVSVYMEAKF